MEAQKKDKWLLLIGAAKCVKGLLLLLAAAGALHLMHHDAAGVLRHWIEMINVDPDNRHLSHLIEKVGGLEPRKFLLMTVGTFLYSGLFLTEGTGLLFQQHWAEYFAVIITGSFLPMEIYEAARHLSAVKIVVIILNAAIVAYLVWKLKHERRHSHGALATAH